MKLNISDDFKPDLDLVTSTQAILAKKGAGKTYTGSVEAEEMLEHGQQVVVIDPTGAWRGLRSAADGKSPGYPIAILGGDHGDVPLEESAGEVIAASIVERRFSAILDLSLFRKGQVHRFMGPFLETLYRQNRSAMHLFVDEADALAPQRPFGEEARTLGAMQDIVRRGRIRGIGCTLITQRSAVLSKDCLTQCDILVTLRLSHPRDIDAVMEWVNVHADPAQAKAMIESLPSLPVGTAWFWSPGWDVFKKVRIRTRRTFDSSATPKVGEKVKAPKVLAPIDIEQLGAQIKATVEQQKANDPAALKKKIADLERQLAARPKEQIEKTVEKIVEVPVLKNGQLDRTEKILGRLEAEASELRRLITPAMAPRPAMAVARPAPRPTMQRVAAARVAPVAAPAPRAEAPAEGLTGTQQKVLDVILMLNRRGIEATRDSVARWLHIHPNGGRYGSDLASLRANDFIDGMLLTDAGREAARKIPIGWDATVAAAKDGTKQTILRTVAEASGPLTRDELAAALGIHPNGGRFGSDLAWLRTMGVITDRGPIALTAGAVKEE